jgi:hypothetical protein
MEYHQYYDGVFSDQDLDHNDRWLVVCIEAAWYCESYGVSYIRFYQLKTKSSDAIKRYTKGRSVLSSGSLDSILRSDRCEGFLRVKKGVGPKKNETRIYPNIPLILKVVQGKKLENLALKVNKRLRFIGPEDTLQRKRSIVEPYVQVSDGLSRQATKVRAPPTESVEISEGIGVVVTRVSRE